VAECVTKRAYSSREIGRWLGEAGFKIRLPGASLSSRRKQAQVVAGGVEPERLIVAPLERSDTVS
jgi:hypothetical protein